MSITKRIKDIQQRILDAERSYHHQHACVKLLAVSKGQSHRDIQEAYKAGIRDFGENYLQEALIKIKALSTLPLCWHFIGPIQSNKTKDIAQYFSWVHSLSRNKIAQQLNDQRPVSMPPLNVCLQVNLDLENSKTGATIDELKELASCVLQLPHLHLSGLMMLPRYRENEDDAFMSFLRLADILHRLNQELNTSMDTLSMGMSHDFEAAIRAGSTMVRIGTAIFGKRRGKS